MATGTVRSVSGIEAFARDRRWWAGVASISLIGSAIRCAFVWFGARGDGPVGDQLFYSAQAIANARGDWFEQPFASGQPAADHPPLTALLVTPITWLFDFTGSVVTAQRLFMVLLGTASIVVIACLTRRIAGRRAGLVGAATTAVYVNVWINDGLIMAETPTFMIMALLTMAVLGACAKPTAYRWFVIGVLCGTAALTRPELVALVPLVTIVLFVSHEGSGRIRMRLVRLAAMWGAATLVVAPWVLWNQARFDAPVFLSTNDGLTIAGGNCDSTYFDDVGGWDIWCAYETEIPEDFDAAQASQLMREAGMDYWRANLGRYPVVAAARLARVFSLGLVGASAQAAVAEGRPVILSHIGTVQYWVLVPLAFIGARRRTTALQRAVLLGAIPIVIAVALVANAYVRFRVPAEVGLVVLASLGIDVLLSGKKDRPLSALGPPWV